MKTTPSGPRAAGWRWLIVAQPGQGEELQARVGIATGLVVVGGEVVEHDVAGETPNLAARLQTLAQPRQIVLAGATRRLVGDLFRLTDLGGQTAKGFAAPVEAFVVEGVAATESRFEAARRGITDLVGRVAESALLRDRLREAWAGAGQIVLLSGEAGIGKSRLAAQLAAEVASEPHTRLRYQCSPYHRDSVLHPFVVALGRAARLAAYFSGMSPAEGWSINRARDRYRMAETSVRAAR